MERIDLLDTFHREVEVLELTDEWMIYALDQKNEIKDICSIEKMNLKTRQIQRLITLDYTRLWESFRTYGQMPGFFYAVNVLADYRVRLRKIDKTTWENTTDFLINPEGEIINIYSLNEDFMIITDEVKAEPEVLERFGMKDEGRRYVNVRYLYEIRTAKKYPIKDSHFDSLTEDIPVRLMCGVPTVVYEAFYRDEYDEGADGGSEILTVPVDEFIAHVKADGMAGLTRVAGAGDDGFDYVRLMAAEDDKIIFRRRTIASGREELVRLSASEDGYAAKILKAYDVPESCSLFYDLAQEKVYGYPEDPDMPSKEVLCLTEPSQAAVYDGKYGSFAGFFGDEWMITTYYDEVMVKEYEYHEYVAIHNLKDGHVETVAGRFERTPGVLVLLRSFLAL